MAFLCSSQIAESWYFTAHDFGIVLSAHLSLHVAILSYKMRAYTRAGLSTACISHHTRHRKRPEEGTALGNSILLPTM